MNFVKIGSLKSVESFKEHLAGISKEVPVDGRILPAPQSPLARPLEARPGGFVIGNRWAIQPMEGWDGAADGNPTELTLRRWRHFGLSGAKLIWGGEAVAVRPDGRANPNQLVIAENTLAGLDRLRAALVEAHGERFGGDRGLFVGLQLTHSGRFSRPEKKAEPRPRIAYRHPILDRRVGVTNDSAVLSDAEVETIIGDFVRAARRARQIGFHFVDLKHCHGYLLHEFLGAHTRPGRYGGSFENRTRLLRELVAGVRREAPELEIGVRVSIFDTIPFRPDPARSGGRQLGPGVPEEFSQLLPYRWGFGVDPTDPARGNFSEGIRFLELCQALGLYLINLSAGSPYYNPHLQRPAAFPPSDGYEPPEDPLRGVARHLLAARDLKRRFPELRIVGSALSYLQDYLPHVAQAAVREGWMDFAGIGRMALAYWDLPADCLEGRGLDRKRLCRTFSDCTTGPRQGLPSGCYPLDPFYAGRPEAEALKAVKSGRKP
ncbi:MAG: NADH:flavin oxidoreductase [Planctomycetes bacterium]|nr:NADH:flavin oxidoreductase [Planctomycetota bacterium]